VFAAGIGPVESGFHRWLIALTLDRADRITVRDRESEQALRFYGFQGKIRLGCDPVLGLDVPRRPPEPETMRRRRIALIVRETRGANGREPAIRAALGLAALSETELLLVGLHPALDDGVLSDAESRCRAEGRTEVRVGRWRTTA